MTESEAETNYRSRIENIRDRSDRNPMQWSRIGNIRDQIDEKNKKIGHERWHCDRSEGKNQLMRALLLLGPNALAEFARGHPNIFAKLPGKMVVILKAYVMGCFRGIPIRMGKKQSCLLNSHSI